MTKLGLFLFLILAGVTASPMSFAEQVAGETLAEEDMYIYERPTHDQLARIYWKLNKFDPNNDTAVDNFMRITECDIYKNYFVDDFEWKQIREATRKHLIKNAESFSTRIELIQPLYLTEYNFENKTFGIWQPYQIDLMKLFELQSPDFDQEICSGIARYAVEGYPKGLIIDTDRLVTLKEVPMDLKTAKRFLSLKKSSGPSSNKRMIRQKELLYRSRDAYLVMNLHLTSYQKDVLQRGSARRPKARVYAEIEGISVYADRNKNYLLYKEDFLDDKNKKGSRAEDALRKYIEEHKKESAPLEMPSADG